MDLKHRQAKLAKLLAAAELPGVAFVPGPNFYYLTGVSLHLMERPTILLATAEGALHAVIPALERDRWSIAAAHVETIYWHDSDGYSDACVALARRCHLTRLGVESGRMRHFEVEALEKAFGFPAVNATDAIADLRLVKEPEEIEAIERAVKLSEAALSDTLSQITIGMAETEIRARLQIAMIERGADKPAFEPIVLCGGASSDCHGVSSAHRRLCAGDPLLIDFGACVDGYSADITRTFFCKSVSEPHRRVYEAVLAANTIGREMVAPGMTFDMLDQVVLGKLSAAGFADMVRHKTGHGLGLDLHELPQVMMGNSLKMLQGQVFTIEPGLYDPDSIGVRIEDDVLVTIDGYRSLTTFPRELCIVGQ